MFENYNFLDMLNQGFTPDELAEDFTKHLNAAIDTINKQEQKKLKDAENLTDIYLDYVRAYYPELNEYLDKINKKEFVKYFTKGLDEGIKNLTKFAKTTEFYKTSSDPIADFLKKYNL